MYIRKISKINRLEIMEKGNYSVGTDSEFILIGSAAD
jgi:hypothetical protein